MFVYTVVPKCVWTQEIMWHLKTSDAKAYHFSSWVNDMMLIYLINLFKNTLPTIHVYKDWIHLI